MSIKPIGNRNASGPPPTESGSAQAGKATAGSAQGMTVLRGAPVASMAQTVVINRAAKFNQLVLGTRHIVSDTGTVPEGIDTARKQAAARKNPRNSSET